ncbi:MAG: ribosomal L7Ae/L30e/S12e/Gadd45 family protein [Nanoarchaeota archaeon]
MEKLRNDLLENSKKLVFGTERNLKLLKNDRLKRIYLAGNCRDDVKKDIRHYGKGVEIIELNTANNEVGVICKKPFSISVIGLTK